jgi:hypothetical protein
MSNEVRPQEEALLHNPSQWQYTPIGSGNGHSWRQDPLPSPSPRIESIDLRVMHTAFQGRAHQRKPRLNRDVQARTESSEFGLPTGSLMAEPRPFGYAKAAGLRADHRSKYSHHPPNGGALANG